MSSIQPLTKKTHRHHTPARRCAYISLSQHTAEQKLGRLTRQVQTSNALWNIHYDEPRAASRSFFSQRHNIQRRDGRRLVMLSEQVDVSSVGSPWSTISRVQDAKQREEERDTDSQRPSTSHVLPFLSLILDYYSRLQWAERPGMPHVEKAASKDAMKSSFYFMILERNWGFRDIIENISLNKNDSVLLKDFFPLNKRSGHLSFDFVLARRRWHLVSNGE